MPGRIWVAPMAEADALANILATLRAAGRWNQHISRCSRSTGCFLMGLLQPFRSPPPSVLAVRPTASHLRGTPLCHSQAHDLRFVPSSCHAGISAGVSHISYLCCFLFPRQRREAPAQVISRAQVIV